MKVNLKKVKPLHMVMTNVVVSIHEFPQFSTERRRRVKFTTGPHSLSFEHEDARALRDWLNKALP